MQMGQGKKTESHAQLEHGGESSKVFALVE
jgi:hypothetical protein